MVSQNNCQLWDRYAGRSFLVIYPKTGPNGMNNKKSKEVTTMILFNTTFLPTVTKITLFPLPNSILNGRSTRKITISGNKFKKIHRGLNLNLHFSLLLLNLWWFLISPLSGGRNGRWSLGATKSRWRSGRRTKKSRGKLTVLTIWLEFYIFLQKWTLKPSTCRAWTK